MQSDISLERMMEDIPSAQAFGSNRFDPNRLLGRELAEHALPDDRCRWSNRRFR
jgi:hypothetical protein